MYSRQIYDEHSCRLLQHQSGFACLAAVLPVGVNGSTCRSTLPFAVCRGNVEVSGLELGQKSRSRSKHIDPLQFICCTHCWLLAAPWWWSRLPQSTHEQNARYSQWRFVRSHTQHAPRLGATEE
jgi:hypothetical protein